MATIQKRPQKNGTNRYRVMIRQSDGFPPVSKTFPTKQEEAKHWAKLEEANRRQGYAPSDCSNKQTLADLINRYETIILPTKPKDARNIKRHLDWWRKVLNAHHRL